MMTTNNDFAAHTSDARQYDKTQLRASVHGKYVHRDYGAHFFRWGFAKRFIKRNDDVLEIGCGQDMPLVQVLSMSTATFPRKYVACDINSISKKPKRSWLEVRDNFNFVTDDTTDLRDFSVIVSFEVIEHMQPEAGQAMLDKCYEALCVGGKLLISTPCYDGVHHAKNHIHEYTIDELRDAIERAGFKIKSRFGTFASKNEIKRAMTDEHQRVYDALSVYYDNDVMACFMAPLYPNNSRNNLWVCEK